MIAIMFEQGGGKRLIMGDERNVVMNLKLFSAEIGTEIRLLDDTPLSNIGTVTDARVPDTAEQFDELYPYVGRWTFPTPSV